MFFLWKLYSYLKQLSGMKFSDWTWPFDIVTNNPKIKSNFSRMFIMSQKAKKIYFFYAFCLSYGCSFLLYQISGYLCIFGCLFGFIQFQPNHIFYSIRIMSPLFTFVCTWKIKDFVHHKADPLGIKAKITVVRLRLLWLEHLKYKTRKPASSSIWFNMYPQVTFFRG